ncbi:hypothetical protein HC028_01060 [Planosporangium flavigriseum]|jgi:hypothetical protein|uniref:Uncharacterized protein n=1 Tax=Planosporangium flavigriseum TaxID=373681 RepID=A0A8J3PNZ0_9ACTN|nr:hypothetical protein [Planosporangium flavigriseum]NJC63108.1 hypothetical protein [Planosporangium flavigriseum]GIG74486.1 hypothetical protein Pfl04_28900 [Planosporangium flavigriseum]
MSVNEPTSRPAPRAGDIVSRVIFGGFWSVVTVAALIAGIVGFSHGQAGVGFGALIVAVLTGLYARYIFRGGRFRILFW